MGSSNKTKKPNKNAKWMPGAIAAAVLLLAAPASALVDVAGSATGQAEAATEYAKGSLGATADAAANGYDPLGATADAAAHADAATDYADAGLDASAGTSGVDADVYADADTAAVCDLVPAVGVEQQLTYTVTGTVTGITGEVAGTEGLQVPPVACPELSLSADADASAGMDGASAEAAADAGVDAGDAEGEANIFVKVWTKLKSLF